MIGNLKLAIDRKDWGLVVEFYRQLTGTLEAPKDEPKNIASQSSRNDFDFSMKREVKPTRVAKPAPPKKRTTKKSKAKASQIQFIDTGDIPDEPGFDKINDKVQPVPRNRKPFKTIKMTCVVCKATDQISPIFKRDPECYKCNKCLTKGKMNGLE